MTSAVPADQEKTGPLVGSAVEYTDYAGRVGRPTIRSQEIVDELLFRLTEGETLRRICRDQHMPGRQTVLEWQRADNDLRADIARAREDGTHATADDCVDISDRGDLEPNDRRIRIETRLKLIAQWNRATYGPKHDVNHSGTISLEAWVLESLPGKPAEIEQARVIEGEAKRVDDTGKDDEL